eukprot:2457-Eustigmatos_ZCMA.PRE.1
MAYVRTCSGNESDGGQQSDDNSGSYAKIPAGVTRVGVFGRFHTLEGVKRHLQHLLSRFPQRSPLASKAQVDLDRGTP